MGAAKRYFSAATQLARTHDNLYEDGAIPPSDRVLPTNIQMLGYPLTHQVKEAIRPYYLRWLYFAFVDGARPDSFRSCWDRPCRRLDEAAELLNGSNNSFEGSDCAVIFFPMNDWHARMQRSQQLARALARLGHPVVYLNPHLGRQFERVRLLDRHHRVSCAEESILELHVRLPREPVFHHRMLRDTASRMIAAAVSRLAGTAGWKRAVQIVELANLDGGLAPTEGPFWLAHCL